MRLVGTQSNRDGVGARLRLTAGGRTQIREVKAGSSYLGQNDVRQHFGLERRPRADRLEVRWPSGRLDVVQDVPADQIITAREGDGVAVDACSHDSEATEDGGHAGPPSAANRCPSLRCGVPRRSRPRGSGCARVERPRAQRAT